jgi:enediyne biosynthesis protein E4
MLERTPGTKDYSNFRRQLYSAVIATGLVFCMACEPGQLKRYMPVSTYSSGIDFNNAIEEDDTANIVDYYYVYNGGGVAIGDINNDGLPDIFFTGNQVPSKLYLNMGHLKFEDITTKAGITKHAWSTGATMADVNGDGLLDIYVCNSGNYPAARRANFLYINKGDLVFEEQAAAVGLADTTYTNQAAFFDYDKDGDLDAYLMTSTNTIRNPNKLTPVKDDGSGPSVDKLYRNDGGHFTDVSAQAGLLHNGFGLGLAITDLNGDGWEDVLVSNDFIANDHLYINNHNGTFTESSRTYFRHHSHFSMGNDVADYNNDGLTDVMVVDMMPFDAARQKRMAGPVNPNAFEAMIRAGYHPQYMRNMLFTNLGTNHQGRPVFAEVGQQMGVHSTDWSWAPLWMDVDLDGWQDLFITNGYLRDVTDMDFIIHNNTTAISNNAARTNAAMRKGARAMPSINPGNFVFRNEQGKAFSDESGNWLGELPSLSNGASYADLDNDGDLDLVISNINEPALVLENRTGRANYIKVALSGTGGNTKGLGSEVTVYAGGLVQTRHLAVTRGYQSSVDYTLVFGLGSTAQADSIVVRWPDDRIEIRRNIAANSVITFDQRQGIPIKSVPATPAGTWLEAQPPAAFGLDYTHEEEFYMDYDVEPLLPHKLSQQGPCLAQGDINGDGRDDLFVGGSYKHAGVFFIQQSNGKFMRRDVPVTGKKQEEDVDAIFFDADGDGDSDLYIVSGSNEFHDGSEYYQDRLLLNDGQGNFTAAPGRLPPIRHSGSCVAVADADHDGDLDIFRGGRVKPLEFPKPGDSYLLINDQGTFTDATTALAPDLVHAGMVTGACWADTDGDQWQDLVLVGEYMPITIFKNVEGRLHITAPPSLQFTNGFWNCITASDIDADGDTDFIAGNKGLNTRYQCSNQKPLCVYGGDLDGNGRWDAIPAFYAGEFEYPTPSLPDLLRQVPMFKKRYQQYEAYARTPMAELIYPVRQQVDYVAKAYEQSTMVIRNIGNNNYQLVPLPAVVQQAPVNAIITGDVNSDAHPDLIMIGNDYDTEPLEGFHDAGVGLILTGNVKEGTFTPVAPRRSGLWVEGAGRKLAMIRSGSNMLIVAVQNQGPLLTFKLTSAAFQPGL